MKRNGFEVTAEAAEEMIIAAGELAKSLFSTAYIEKAKAILTPDGDKPGEEKAADFVLQYADITGASLRIIATALDIVTAGFIDDEIQITETTQA